jgi:hypothetical protein
MIKRLMWKLQFVFWMTYESRWLGGVTYFWGDEAWSWLDSDPDEVDEDPRLCATEAMSYWID